jgi:hypothetical protein
MLSTTRRSNHGIPNWEEQRLHFTDRGAWRLEETERRGFTDPADRALGTSPNQFLDLRVAENTVVDLPEE